VSQLGQTEYRDHTSFTKLARLCSSTVDMDDLVVERGGVEWTDIGGVPCLYADLTTEKSEY
jgi:hypothetical protein